MRFYAVILAGKGFQRFGPEDVIVINNSGFHWLEEGLYDRDG